ncbi:MAG: phosphoglycerate kinase [Candidatus Nealsonbacteria bacterium]|nr:phosphoglycerate kinase [Candidatus Nealsonbacteria bacterium]
MKQLGDFDFKNKRVLLRCDFDVPLSNGVILDDFRIKKALPTIEYLVEKGAKLVLIGHLDRPGGKVIENLRLTLIQERISERLGLPVIKAEDCLGQEVERMVNGLKSGEVLLLENLRFYKEEEGNDDNFAGNLAKLGEIYINNAFANSHRAHASIVGLPKHLPSCAGLLFEKEIRALSKIKDNPERPLLAIIGGAKVETKTGLIDKISEKADFVLIGGLIKEEIKKNNIKLKYPEKVVEPVNDVGKKDIGPETIALFKEKIRSAKTVFWNGPLGQTEKDEFCFGTSEIAKAIIDSGAFSVAGGGETIEFLNKISLIDKFSHVSTGGGAMITFLSGESLPGIEALA